MSTNSLETLKPAMRRQNLRHYFLAHKLHLMVKSELRRLARLLLQLFELDIICVTPKVIKSQTVIDMLALFPEEEEATISKEVIAELQEFVVTATIDVPQILKK
ncbi:hypothetical protein D8674_013791 [Pyrus ussuriensis x Pyrus communis]|uniref:Uncharacterized protein n=1 Tax=Pyrus ussuriensis x Pyrus communis TaxID=2448454 RepID=A0A5N5GW51_9ROSA|nr:hypothetical protein D8674_013791 [Pyrus ussuriensis x Pyrus communis]